MLLKNVRLSFPDLFRATTFEAGQEPKFGGMFILEPGHPQIAEVQEAIQKAAMEKWPKALPSTLPLCMRPNTDKSHLEGFDEGGWFINASSKKRPTVIDRDRAPLAEEDGKPYAGCYVNAILDVWALNNPKYPKRICAELKGVQFVMDGEAFGGSSPAQANDFDLLEEAAPVPTAADTFGPAGSQPVAAPREGTTPPLATTPPVQTGTVANALFH